MLLRLVNNRRHQELVGDEGHVVATLSPGSGTIQEEPRGVLQPCRGCARRILS